MQIVLRTHQSSAGCCNRCPGVAAQSAIRMLAGFLKCAGRAERHAAGHDLSSGQARHDRLARRCAPLSFHNFERPMGTAVGQDALAIGTKEQIWLLKSAPDIAPQIDPSGTYHDCYLARSSHFSGDIQCHEMAFCGGELWIVNTLFSCLCTLGQRYSFVPRWQPPFITGLAAEDRCHLNGLAIEDAEPRYVTALGETDAPAVGAKVKPATAA